jgi:lysophospholipid hydrolase
LANKQNERKLEDDPRILMIHPPVQDYGVVEFEAWRDIMDIGYEYGKAIVNQWQQDGTILRLLPNSIDADSEIIQRRIRRKSL